MPLKTGEGHSEHSDEVVIDFPRQIHNMMEDSKKVPLANERQSRLIQEID